MTGPASVAFTLPQGGVSGPLNAGRTGIVLSVVEKQEPSTDEIAKNFGSTRQQMLDSRREEVFRVYLGTLSDKYKKAGAIRMKVQPAKGLPVGS